MKIIGFEEHYTLPAIADANPNSPRKLFDESRGGSGWPTPGIVDLGEGRIAAMDAAGIDVQILSNVPGVEAIETPRAVELARQANDAVVAAATEHPERFLGFATLPMRDPDAAVAELERTVRDHGFVGALINGHVDGRYLDDPFFWPVFESAEALDVPIYLHPT
ncbi:MAG: amidohydrolase family protein, partial [Mycobacterium sp.]